MIKEILKGHISPETAYIVDDYPYGFRLRCKIRYWLETNKKGTRFCSQTTNPKRGDVWNKAKASTYAMFAGCMFLNEEGHVAWHGLNQYTTATEAENWLNTHREGLCEFDLNRASYWVKRKKKYEAERKEHPERFEMKMVLRQII